MTTIILTIIGILLAAAAALMVIFYGGDAFNGGSIGAQANTYQNAGTNVIAAVQLAKADNASWTGMTGATGLAGDGTDPDKNYLKEVPALNEASNVVLVSPTEAASATPPTASSANGTVLLATVGGVNAAAVCDRINKNLKLASAPTAYSSTIKMGCATTGTVFFANA